MRQIATKRRLAAGEPSYGVGMLWPAPELVELCGHLGFDWLWLDLEHGAFDLQALTQVVRAAEATGMDTIGRVSHTRDRDQILRYLETGLSGIIFPHVTSAEDVRFAVDAVKYPPIGSRSAGLFRPGGWGPGARPGRYYDDANSQTIVMALIEEEEGVENLDEILSVEGLDAAVIGFGDLSLTMGHPGAKDHPDVQRVGGGGQERILASDVALQVTVQDGGEAKEWIDRGALMVRCSLQQVLAPALREWLVSAGKA